MTADPREVVGTAARILAAAGHNDLISGHASMQNSSGVGIWVKASG